MKEAIITFALAVTAAFKRPNSIPAKATALAKLGDEFRKAAEIIFDVPVPLDGVAQPVNRGAVIVVLKDGLGYAKDHAVLVTGQKDFMALNVNGVVGPKLPKADPNAWRIATAAEAKAFFDLLDWDKALTSASVKDLIAEELVK